MFQPLHLISVFVALMASALGAGELYQQHVIFDNSHADRSYYHSRAVVIGPSELEISSGRFPVDVERRVSPPNSLRLQWRSRPGGDWRMTLNVVTRYGQRFKYDGDTLSLWCYAESGLEPDASPRIGLRDGQGNALPDIGLLTGHGPLPAAQWTNIRIKLTQFRGQFLGTDDFHFDPSNLASIEFSQGLDDDSPRSLLLDDIFLIDGNVQDLQPPTIPTGLTIEGHDRHFDLSWSPNREPDLVSYRVYRSWDGSEFQPIGTGPADVARYVDHIGLPHRTAHYRISAVDLHNNESAHSAPATGTSVPCNDDRLLDMIQQSCFRYYWEGANPESGMALEIYPGDKNLVAVGASGFGIMAMVVATERGFISRDAVVQRLLQIVRYLERADRFHGAWPHFLDGRTGRVIPYFGKYDNGGDLVETAFLVQGLLAARQYFDRPTREEAEIRDTITRLWHGVEWAWYRRTPDSDVLYWHWSPDAGWHISHPLIGWNETMIVYLLAIASPTHGVPAELYYTGWAGQSQQAIEYRRNWSRTTAGDHYANGNEYYGIRLDVGSGTGGDLFFTQFSFLGFDPRGQRDRYTNYFENNRRIAQINRAYCIENPRQFAGYGPNCWGRSAGIHSGGGRPLPRDDNGTICTSAALGSFPYTPDESMAALKHFYHELGSQIFGVYGFHDGFNQTENWFDEVYMGLNQAQIVVGIENHRTRLVWKSFMKNPEVSPMLKAIGFQTMNPSPGPNQED